ncbi:hypothetical protein SAMN05421812_13443 [Asanoa hainanensis]|uniref:Uncharacterized protein n=1 Tax=Asanoa hainanensis TaxID=560556 RepID=A0A239PGF5_9ACTN|nr:hypothetical protein SAMN05421812_13443 [Asanoa hainanensis]
MTAVTATVTVAAMATVTATGDQASLSIDRAAPSRPVGSSGHCVVHRLVCGGARLALRGHRHQRRQLRKSPAVLDMVKSNRPRP